MEISLYLRYNVAINFLMRNNSYRSSRGINMHTVFQSEATGDGNKRLIELEKMKKNLEHQLQEMAKTVERQQEMIAMAKRDPLTGLRNRQGIPELVNARLREACEGIFFHHGYG